MAALRRFRALERALDGDLAAPASAEEWQARADSQLFVLTDELVEINHLQGSGSHGQRLEALKVAAGLLPKVERAWPVLMETFPFTLPYLMGLLHVSSMLLELTDTVLDEAPPGARPPADADCYNAAAWSAVLLAPAVTILQCRGPTIAATAPLLAGVSRPLKQLLIRLARSEAQPFAHRLSSGPARLALLVGAVREVLAAAVFLDEQQGLSDVEAWRDAVPVLMLLTNPSHAPLLAALMRERRSAPREIACLAMRCTQHGSAWLAVAPPAEVTTLQWRQLLGYAFNALHAAALMPFALAFARGCEGPDLLRAMAGALGALPRKAPAGQAPVDHATTQCFAVVVALKLLEVAYYDPAGRGTACPPVGLTPVEALLLWCDVELAATAVLSAATEYGGAALQAHADTLSHGLGPRDTWSMAIAAWDLSAIMTCMVHAHAQDALTRQVDAARTPQQRAAAWRAVRQLCAAAECLLRLAPKLPREGTDEAAVLSPAGVHADAACGLAETAFMAAEALRGGAAMQPGRRFPSEPAASEAAADDAAAAIADLGFTLSKRALLWASRPAAQLDECTRDLLGPSAHGKTSEAADRYARETVLILLRSSYTAFCCSYCSGKEETSFDSLKTLLPLVHTLAAAAEALSASLPADVRGEVAEMLRGIAQTMAVGADSQLIRPDPSGQCPPSVVELLLWADRPCAHVRCTTLRGAGERALKGRLCSGCRKARFCGDACARAGWRQHKEACKWVQQNREAAARGEEGVS